MWAVRALNSYPRQGKTRQLECSLFPLGAGSLLRTPAAQLTLQKSILFTPLLPRAGPTGGLGLAWPAPTMSLTIWSLANAFFAMVE